jgi:hypothetical protein
MLFILPFSIKSDQVTLSFEQIVIITAESKVFVVDALMMQAEIEQVS